MQQKDREALNNALNEIENEFGKGALVQHTRAPMLEDIEVSSTGIIELDTILGIPGYPKGKVVEIFGGESTGKTSMVLQAVAEVQSNGGIAAYVDAEHALSLPYATDLGVNVTDLLFSQPDYGEQALSVVETLTKTKAVDIIIVDSVAALLPKIEMEGDIEEEFIGAQAALMSASLRRLVAAVNKSNMILIFTNQVRRNVGDKWRGTESTPGGRALQFYASIRIELQEVFQVTDSLMLTTPDHKDINATVIKNKFATPFTSAQLKLLYGQGFVNN